MVLGSRSFDLSQLLSTSRRVDLNMFEDSGLFVSIHLCSTEGREGGKDCSQMLTSSQLLGERERERERWRGHGGRKKQILLYRNTIRNLVSVFS